MDNHELENELKQIKAELKAIKRQFERLAIATDEVRRRTNLPGIMDPQVLAINSRANERAL